MRRWSTPMGKLPSKEWGGSKFPHLGMKAPGGGPVWAPEGHRFIARGGCRPWGRDQRNH